jgi:sulfur carrier protein
MGGVKVLLRNPKRELEVPGPIGVLSLLRQLGYTREAVLVIVNGTLVTEDATIPEGSEVEVRPVVSGGAVVTDRPGASLRVTTPPDGDEPGHRLGAPLSAP